MGSQLEPTLFQKALAMAVRFARALEETGAAAMVAFTAAWMEAGTGVGPLA